MFTSLINIKALLLYLKKSWIESGTLAVFNSLAISFLSKIPTRLQPSQLTYLNRDLTLTS